VAPLGFGDHRHALHDRAGRSRVRREPGQGLSDLAVGLLATVVPVLFVAGVLPLVMNPAYETAARREVATAIDSTHPQRARIAEFYAANARLPETLAEAGVEPSPAAVAAMTYGGGIMRLELPSKDRRSPPRLVFTAQTHSAALAWKCSAEKSEGKASGGVPGGLVLGGRGWGTLNRVLHRLKQNRSSIHGIHHECNCFNFS
jgi:hypothetical protein